MSRLFADFKILVMQLLQESSSNLFSIKKSKNKTFKRIYALHRAFVMYGGGVCVWGGLGVWVDKITSE